MFALMFLQWLPEDVGVVDQDEGTYSRRDASFILLPFLFFYCKLY